LVSITLMALFDQASPGRCPVRLARGTSALDLVSYLRAADEQVARRRDVLAVLTERYALPFDDARLAMDRVSGGAVRATTGNPANAPDKAKDLLAWISYRLELGLSVEEEAVVEPSSEQRAAAEALVAGAKRGEPARGTEDVAVALEVARLAVASQEPDRTRFHLLIEAATSLSVAAEACIRRLGRQPCAPEGSPEWVDGVTLVGRAMLESARCYQRNGDPERAATHVEAVLADFGLLLDEFADEDPFDEYVLALEYLLAAVELTIEVRGTSTELDALRRRFPTAKG